MKKRLQGFFAGVVLTLIFTGAFAIAEEVYESISVIYNNIKIEIDGENFVATNVNGEIVEPFIYEGTTYLPVRAIATAFDKDVAWDEQTYTVSLKSKNVETNDETPEKTEDKEPENGKGLTSEQIVGVWYADFTDMLVSIGLPESFAENYNVYGRYEFKEDGTYTIGLDDKAIDTIVDMSFEYALAEYGITEEQYPMVSGVSVEETKKAIKEEVLLMELSENGTYGFDGTKMFFRVDGSGDEYYEASIENGALKLSGSAVLVLVREIP